MAYRRKNLATLLLMPVVAANVALAADDAAYRSGKFDQAEIDMVACAASVMAKRHPELQFILGKTDGHVSVTGVRSGDGSSAIWLVVAKAAGSKSTRVELRGKGAGPEELVEVWQVIEACEDQ